MLTSKVRRHEGLCKPTWVNCNQVCNRFDNGVTGFFKLVKRRFGFYLKTGKEFHGIVRSNNIASVIITTAESIVDAKGVRYLGCNLPNTGGKS